MKLYLYKKLLRIHKLVLGSCAIILLIPSPAKAQQKLMLCSTNEVLIRLVDKTTIICRHVDPNRECRIISRSADICEMTKNKILDELNLYRWGENKKLLSLINVYVNTKNEKRFIIGDYTNCSLKQALFECSQVTGFSVIGRRFNEWSSTANMQLLEKYSKDITLLLDTLEKYPVEKPNF
ncbi:hypothetical protein CAL7716_004160 [Calothrix sp. PCC 7716]|nr:hypothetical protein CAL7716_004160 [Calothrix sp. PCC 7716]